MIRASKPYRKKEIDFLLCDLRVIGALSLSHSPILKAQKKAKDNKTKRFEIFSLSFKCVSSKQNPLVFKHPNSVCRVKDWRGICRDPFPVPPHRNCAWSFPSHSSPNRFLLKGYVSFRKAAAFIIHFRCLKVMDFPVPEESQYAINVFITPPLPSYAAFLSSLSSRKKNSDLHFHIVSYLSKCPIRVSDTKVINPSC